MKVILSAVTGKQTSWVPRPLYGWFTHNVLCALQVNRSGGGVVRAERGTFLLVYGKNGKLALESDD